MKVLERNSNACISCRKCEKICSKTWFKEENAEKSCIRINQAMETETQNRIVSCTQCGECIIVCPVEALKRDAKGIIRIDKKACVGCFICVGFCPEYAMMVHKDLNEPFKCIACGICVKECPTGAITIKESV